MRLDLVVFDHAVQKLVEQHGILLEDARLFERFLHIAGFSQFLLIQRKGLAGDHFLEQAPTHLFQFQFVAAQLPI